MVLGIDEDLVIPDKRLSVYEGGVAPWKGEKLGKWKEDLFAVPDKFDFPVHKPHCRSYARTDAGSLGRKPACVWHQRFF
jgi:excinuclease UvrABC ATPase subunit